MAEWLLESSSVACLTHCDIHECSTNNSGSLDGIFPAHVVLDSPGSNTLSITLSVTGLQCIFDIMLQAIKGTISLILIGVTRVKAKFTELVLFLILFPCLCIKPFNF